MKEQEAKGFLNNIGLKTPLSKIPILGYVLINIVYKMNELVNEFLLAGDKYMAEMHSK